MYNHGATASVCSSWHENVTSAEIISEKPRSHTRIQYGVSVYAPYERENDCLECQIVYKLIAVRWDGVLRLLLGNHTHHPAGYIPFGHDIARRFAKITMYSSLRITEITFFSSYLRWGKHLKPLVKNRLFCSLKKEWKKTLMKIVITKVYRSWIHVQTRFSVRAWWIIDQIKE